MKQTKSWYLKLPLKPAFFIVLLISFERSVFAYFKLIYFRISKQNFSMARDEEGFFNNAPDWKLFFFFKIEIKRKPGCPNKEYSSVLEDIHQIIRAYPRGKGNLHWSMNMKIFLDIGKNPSRASCKQTGVVWSKYI